MVVKKIAIVMALYDIGRNNWEHFNLSYDTYLFWMKNTLSLDSNFIIYTESKFINKIINIRKEFDPTFEKTKFIILPIYELDSYKRYYNRLENMMVSDDFIKKIHHHNVPEMNKPLYNIIMFNKLNFLKHSKDEKYFDVDMLGWLDAGGLRDNINNYKGVKYPSLEKINIYEINKPIFFSHRKEFDIEDNEFHALSQIRYIQGTAFFIPIIKIDELFFEFNVTIEESINSGFIGSDEKIFDLTYVKNKNKYTLIESTWREYFNIMK